jgi:hypothetical protein
MRDLCWAVGNHPDSYLEAALAQLFVGPLSAFHSFTANTRRDPLLLMAASNANIHVREPSAIPVQHIDPQQQQGQGFATDQGDELLTPAYDQSIQTSRQDLEPDAPILIDTLSFSAPIFDPESPYSDQTSKLTLRDQTRALVTRPSKTIGPWRCLCSN